MASRCYRKMKSLGPNNILTCKVQSRLFRYQLEIRKQIMISMKPSAMEMMTRRWKILFLLSMQKMN